MFGAVDGPTVREPVRRADLENLLSNRLGLRVMRDFAAVGDRDLMTVADDSTVAGYAYNRRVFEEKADADGFVTLPLSRGGSATFARDTDWRVFEASPGPGTLLTALEPRDLASVVGELYDMALQRAHGERPGKFPIELAGIGVARKSSGGTTTFTDEKTGRILLRQTPFEVEGVGRHSFMRFVVPLPRELAVLGADYRAQTTDALVVTTDAEGRIIGVGPHASDAQAHSLAAARKHLATRSNVVAEADYRERRRAKLRTEIANLARIRDTLAATSRVEPGMEEAVAAAPPFLVAYRMWKDRHPRSGEPHAPLYGKGEQVDVYVRALVLLEDCENELKEALKEPTIFAEARAEAARRRENLRALLDPQLGAGSATHRWRPTQHLLGLYWRREEAGMTAVESAQMLSVLRRAETLALDEATQRKLIALLPEGKDFAAGYARADEFLAKREGKLARPLILEP